MEDKIYPNLLQGVLLTLSLVVILFLTGLSDIILLRYKIDEPNYYDSLVGLIFTVLCIPIILSALKKSNVSLYNKQSYPRLIFIVALLLLAVTFQICAAPINNPINYFQRLLIGKLSLLGFKSWEIDVSFTIKFFHIVIISPILEEIFFRGILTQQYLKKYSPLKAIIISSLLFAFYHFSLTNILLLLAAGILFGYIYHKTRSIIPCILIHSFYNLTTLFTTVYAIPIETFNVIKFVLVIGTSCFVLFYILKNIDSIQNMKKIQKVKN